MEKGTGFFRFNMRRPVPKIGMNGQLFFFFKQKLQTIDTRFNGWAVPTNPVTSDPETFQEKENHSGRYRFVECSILNEGLFIWIMHFKTTNKSHWVSIELTNIRLKYDFNKF